jgi:hypothetical protein
MLFGRKKRTKHDAFRVVKLGIRSETKHDAFRVVKLGIRSDWVRKRPGSNALDS